LGIGLLKLGSCPDRDIIGMIVPILGLTVPFGSFSKQPAVLAYPPDG